MKECNKEKNHVNSKPLAIYISLFSNKVRHPITENFTTLHFTTLLDTSLPRI